MIYNLVAILGVLGQVLAAPTNIDINAILDANAEGGNAEIGDNEVFDATTYLARAGYLDDLDQTKDRHYAPDNLKQAVKEFQTFVGLNVTGDLDRPTVEFMKKPRCGVADVIKPSKRPSPGAPLAYVTTTEWHKMDLKYKFGSYSRHLDESSQRRTIRDALSRWSAVSQLNFWKVRDSDSEAADIVFRFEEGDHGDHNPFDGRGGTLAHAFQPETGIIHFDDGEDWTLNSPQGENLLHAAIHEIGHVLGLEHTSDSNAIMYPWKIKYVPNPHLMSDDIAGIQSLYGSRADSTGIPTPPPTMGPTRGSTCNVRFDAIETVHDGTTYAFSGRDMYSIPPEGGPLRHNLIRNMYRGAPDAPDAVAYSSELKKLFYFKGDQYWRFTDYNLDSGYPKKLAQDFKNPDAAMGKLNGYITLFKDGQINDWDEGSTHIDRWDSIERSYKGAPNDIQAAFVAPSRNVYLFKDTQYWMYEYRERTTSPKLPEDMRPFWLNCGHLRREDMENIKPYWA